MRVTKTTILEAVREFAKGMVKEPLPAPRGLLSEEEVRAVMGCERNKNGGLIYERQE
jgi:hypothetical protein